MIGLNFNDKMKIVFKNSFSKNRFTFNYNHKLSQIVKFYTFFMIKSKSKPKIEIMQIFLANE